MTARLVGILLMLSLAVPATAQREPCPEERQRAAAIRARIEDDWPLRRVDAVTRYIQTFGRDLAVRAGIGRVSRWRFSVVQDTSINAYSIGDGQVYITEGAILAAADEAELAAILAHEIGHDIAGHFCSRTDEDRNKTPWWDIFSRSASSPRSPQRTSSYYGSLRQIIDPAKEQEADRYAELVLRRSGFDPAARRSIAHRIARGSGGGDPSHLSFLAHREYSGSLPGRSDLNRSHPDRELYRVQQLLLNDHR